MNRITSILEKEDLSVGVFGLGESNLGAIRYLRQKNPGLRLTVRSDEEKIDSSLDNVSKCFLGKEALNNITEDILLLSPSVKRERKQISMAKKRGVIISSDAELFFSTYKCSPIGVTGSDGKSTTTHLIARAFTLSGIEALPCGNYGKSLSSLLDKDIFPVAELSSFQLSYLKPKLSYAVITNITPNHLNWHSTLEDYILAKMNITKNADKIIFDADSEIASLWLGKREVFCKTSLLKSYRELKEIGGSENYVTYKDGIIYLNGSPLLDISGSKRKESYNVRNFLLTTSTCMEKCKLSGMRDAIVDFFGLPHRAELVSERNGLKFIDSSIDSSPERTIKTLSSLEERAIVIIGGKGKGLSLDTLADKLPHISKAAVLLGEVGSHLKAILTERSLDYEFISAANMREAIEKAIAISKGKGTIILSPSATSFDLYKNFEERGNDFKRIVLSLN